MKRSFLTLIVLSLTLLNAGNSRAQSLEPISDYGRGVPTNIIWSPDGTSILVFTRTNTLWRYPVADLTHYDTITDVESAFFTPDGRWLVTRSPEDVYAVRSADDFNQLVLGNLNSARAVSTQWLLTSDADGLTDIRRLDDPQQIALENAQMVNFNPQGTRALIRQDDHLNVYDGITLTPLADQPTFAEDVVHYQWSYDGEQVAALSDGDRVDVWNFADPQLSHSIILSNRTRYDHLDWSPDGTRFLNFDYAGNARVWDVQTGDLLLELPSDQTYYTSEELAQMPPWYLAPSFWALNWSSDGSHILRCHSAGDTYLMCSSHDANTGNVYQGMSGEADWFGFDFSPDRRYFAFSTGLHDANTGALIGELESGFGGYPIEWSANSTHVALVSQYAFAVFVHRTDNAEQIARLPIVGLTFATTRLIWSPDNRHLVVWGGWNGNNPGSGLITVWDTDTEQEAARITEHVLYGQELFFSSDSSLLAATDALGGLGVFNTATGALLHRLDGHEGQITHLAWQPSGTLIATTDGSNGHEYPPLAYNDGNLVRLWDAQTGELVTTLTAQSQVSQLSWSPSGDYLIVDDQIRVYRYEVASGNWGQIEGEVYPSSFPYFIWSANSEIIIREFYACSHAGLSYNLYSVVTGEILTRIGCTLPDTIPVWMSSLGRFVQAWSWCDQPVWANENHCEVRVSFLADAIASDSVEYTQTWDAPHITVGTFTRGVSLAWSPDHTRLLVMENGRAHMWSIGLDRAELLRVFRSFTEAQWSPNGQMLAGIRGDQVVVLDAATGEPRFALANVSAPTWVNRYLSVCRGDPCVRELWDVDSENLIVSNLHPSFTVSEDGRYAANTHDGVLHLYTLESAMP